MKIVSKAVSAAFGLIFIGSTVFSQSLPDAKKAIDAEQYQKAKSILKNLKNTQPTKDENDFYLGLVYVIQDYPDSAKAEFNSGIGKNPKSALNYVGLGTVDRLDKNESSAKANFDRAVSMAGKDVKPYIYIGKAYLMKPYDAKAAIAVLEKAKTIGGKDGSKDPELFTTLGDAYRTDGNSNNAYLSYTAGHDLNPNAPAIAVNIGVLWKSAANYDDAIKQFQSAITLDANFGPAYRELAETDLLIAKNDPKQASAKVKEAADYYKKYLDLTDRSIESRMHYADFLIQAGDYKTLEQEANSLAQTNKSDLRIYRYLGYSAYENGNYAAGLQAMNKWISSADAKRIIPRDYLYLGRLQLKTPGEDSLGILTLRKALLIDTTQVDLYGEIANSLYIKKKYIDAADAYKTYIEKSHRAKLTDYFREGLGYYFGYDQQATAAEKNKAIKPDTTLLTKADSAFAYVIKKTSPPNASAVLYRAYVNDAKETDREKNYKGYARPYYEQYIEVVAPTNPTDEQIKKNLVGAYTYLGYYYEFVAKDETKAADNWNKAKDIDPANKQVQSYLTRKGGTAGKGK